MPSRSALLLVPLLLALCAATAGAEPPTWRLGEPWEDALERGVAAQEGALARGAAHDTLVDRARLAARRDASPVSLYLLARAYGLRAQAGEAAAVAGDRASARAAYTEVLALAPRCYAAHHDLGVLTLQDDAHAHAAAAAHFERALVLNPRYTPSLRQLVRLHLGAGHAAAAAPLLERILAAEPADDEARVRLAVAYADLGRHAASDRMLEVLLARPDADARWMRVRAQTRLAHGRAAEALGDWRHLARAGPGTPEPFLGMLACLAALEEAGRPAPKAEYVFALRGLKRLERDPERRTRLESDIRRAEHALATPRGEVGAAPSTAQLLHALADPDEDGRVRALLHVLVHVPQPDTTLMRTIARHAVPESEPSPSVRAGAVRVLGRVGGTRILAVLRHALDDADALVVVEAADTLTAIARRDHDAVRSVVAILGLHVVDARAEVASVVQQCLLALTDTTLGIPRRDTEGTSPRASFLDWWRGSEGVDWQVRALDGYHRGGDLAADQVLVPYLESPDFFVFRAAVRALERARPAQVEDPWRAWWAALPVFDEARLKKEHWASLKVEMAAWVRGRPGR